MPVVPGLRCTRCLGRCHGARGSRAIHSLTGHGGRRGSAVPAVLGLVSRCPQFQGHSFIHGARGSAVAVLALTVPAVPGPRCPRFPGHSFVRSQGAAGDAGVPWPRLRCSRCTRSRCRAAGCRGRGTRGDLAARSRVSARTAVTVNVCSIQPFFPQLFFLGQ